jgi:hypothetical protein
VDDTPRVVYMTLSLQIFLKQKFVGVLRSCRLEKMVNVTISEQLTLERGTVHLDLSNCRVQQMFVVEDGMVLANVSVRKKALYKFADEGAMRKDQNVCGRLCILW